MSHGIFTKNDLLLLREASLSSMAIGTGLTYIGRYDFVQYGYFYSGLQSICVGIERLIKLILIYDYRLDNSDDFPKNNYLKQFSHNLTHLFNKAREINRVQATAVDDVFLASDSIYESILGIMTDYAQQARYYNLDYLSGKEQTRGEPLQRWDD